MVKKFNITVLLLVLMMASKTCFALTQTETAEYQLKAACLYNLIKFVEWPQKIEDSNQITVGVIGTEPLAGFLGPLKDTKVKNKKVLIRQFPSYQEIQKSDKKAMEEQLESVKKCNLLFICPSEAVNIKEILGLLTDTNVLTVGQDENFLKEGGMVNFVIEDQKVRFEINLAASDKAKLKISSQLLQLAKKVVKAKGNP